MKSKQKTKEVVLSQIYSTIIFLFFYKYHNTNEFTKRSLDSKLNDLKEFKNKLQIFYHDNIEIKPNNEDQMKDLEERKFVSDTALELYNKLPRIYKTQYNKLTKTKKKKIKVHNVHENLSIDFYLDEDEDDLPPMPPQEGDAETNAERVKLNP